jgi:hypothetical protein
MSASTTLALLGNAIIASIVDLAQTVITTYLPYVWVFIVVAALIGLGYMIFHRIMGGGHR